MILLVTFLTNVLALGYFMYSHYSKSEEKTIGNLLDRFGIKHISFTNFVLSTIVALVLFAAQFFVIKLWIYFYPEQMQLAVTQQNQLYNGTVLWHRLIIFGFSGVVEEIIFRGYIQPKTGIIFTSLLFALLHIQYGLSIIMLFVFIGSLLFGILKNKTNTTSSIISHVAYNLLIQIF